MLSMLVLLMLMEVFEEFELVLEDVDVDALCGSW